MNKKLITTIILTMAVMLPAIAENDKSAEKLETVAINEQAQVENPETATEVKTETVPTVDGLEEHLNESAEKATQIDSAKSVADKINASLKKEEYHSEVASENIGQIVTVDDCVKIALASHPSIVSAKSSAEIYKTKIAQAWSAFFPQIGVGAEYSRNNTLVTSLASVNKSYDMYYVPTLSASMKIFDFGKTKTQADIAKKTYEASEDDVQRSINDVIFNVKKSYYNLLFAMQQEKVMTDSVHDFQIHLEQANAFYRIGTKAKIDVLTAEYNLGKAKLDLIQSKNSVKLAYANVNNAIGQPEFENYAIDENLETRTYEIALQDMLNTAFETRPEYLAAKKKAEGSQLLVRASKRAFLPDLNAFAAFQYGGKSVGDDTGYQVGGNLSYSNFNGLLLKKQVDEAKATARRDTADLENTRQAVYLEVKQAYIDLQNAKDSIPVSQLAMMRAKEQYDLASGRYKVGLGDAVELKDAENTYRKAQLEYYSNLMNYNVAAANLERVTGAPITPIVNDTETEQNNDQNT